MRVDVDMISRALKTGAQRSFTLRRSNFDRPIISLYSFEDVVNADANASTLAAIFYLDCSDIWMDAFQDAMKMQRGEPWKLQQSKLPDPHVRVQRFKFYVTGA